MASPPITIQIAGAAGLSREIARGVAKYRRAQRKLMRDAVKVVRVAAIKALESSGLRVPGPPRPRGKNEPKWRTRNASVRRHVVGLAFGSARREVSGIIRPMSRFFYLAFHESGYELRRRTRSGGMQVVGRVRARSWIQPAYESSKDEAARILGNESVDILLGTRGRRA